ncbi:hypothetical protein ACFL0Z_00550 [Patescibacteria group bacterium]
MNNLVDLLLPIKGDWQPAQAHQPTQAKLARTKKKTSSGFGSVPPQPQPPPPIVVSRAFGGRAILMIIIIIVGILGFIFLQGF